MTKQKRSFFEKFGFKKENSSESLDLENSTGDGYCNNYQNSYEENAHYEIPQNPSPVIENQDQSYRKEFSHQPEQFIEETPAPSQSVSENHQSVAETDAEGQLTIDVYQTDDDIVIKSTIAGVKPEDLDININNDMVTIRGERKQEEEIDSENYYYQECYWGPFSRSVILPVEIITEKAEATMKNGILTLRLPKADVTRTRKIQVRGF